MKRFILVLLLVLSASGLFASERLYYKKHKNGTMTLSKENQRFILKMDEVKEDGFNYITIIDIKNKDMAMEFVFVLENNCKNGNYYDFIEQVYEDGKDDLDLVEYNNYFKDDNLVLEVKYKCDAE